MGSVTQLAQHAIQPGMRYYKHLLCEIKTLKALNCDLTSSTIREWMVKLIKTDMALTSPFELSNMANTLESRAPQMESISQ